MASSRLTTPLVLLCAVGVVFLAASDPTRPAAVVRDDLEDMFVPRASWLAESIRSGRFPAWNPQVGCGIDQYATLQGAVWYPPMWLHALLPLPVSLGLLAYGHLLLAAGGLYCWLRGLNVGRPAAVLAAVVLAFGAVGESRWPTMLYALAWIPWQFCILDRPGTFTLRRWLLLAGIFALQFSTAYPQFIVYGAIALGIYGIAKSAAERALRYAFAPPTAALFGALLLAVQLWPSLCYLRTECWRQGAVTPAEAHYLSGIETSSLVDQWSRILPKAIENSSKGRQLSNRFSYGYLGIAMPIAALVAVAWGRTWRAMFFALLALAGLYLSGGYSRGSETVYELFAMLPLAGGFRMPDRLMVWYLLGCCVLLGLGADQLFRTTLNRKAIVIIVALLAALAALRGGLAAILGGDAINLTIWLGGIGLLAWIALRSPREKACGASNHFALAFVLLSLADLWLASAYFCPYFRFPTSWFDTIQTREQRRLTVDGIAQLASRAGHDRLYIAGPYRQVMRTSYLPFFRTLPMYESLMPARHYQLSNAVFPAEKPKYRHFTYWDIPPIPHQRVFDWCSIRYLHAEVALADAEANGWRKVDEWSDLYGGVVYENERYFQRASLRSDVRVEPPETTLARISQPATEFEQCTVFLESQPAATYTAATGSSQAVSAGDVTWLLDEPGSLKLAVECSRPAILLLTESYSTGWSATLDDSPVPILRANFLHQAIEIPTGKHVVTLRFATPGLRFGLGLSLTGLALFGMLGILSFRAPTAANARAATPGSVGIRNLAQTDQRVPGAN